MAVVRLFGPARDVVGAPSTNVPGATVADVLDAMTVRYGPAFAELLCVSKVWVGPDPVGPDEPLAPDDELAVLPPVSGG